MAKNWKTKLIHSDAKIPDGFLRNTLGKALDSLYSTGERDKFRTRVERSAKGSEIYLSHKGMVEVYSGDWPLALA